MDYITLGRTNIKVNKNGFGALPIQRITNEEAVSLLRKAYNAGITYYDTARAYTDSETKLGNAFGELFKKERHKFIIATKTTAETARIFWQHLEQSLTELKTDYVDILQFHNPPFVPLPGGKDGLYDAIKEAQSQGKVKYIGFTNHRLPVATEAVSSGLYDVLQFPFSYLSDKADSDLVHLCAEKDVGFVCMKALSGGLITDSAMAYASMMEYPNILPIWGIQRDSELEEFISYQTSPPMMTDEMRAKISQDKKELGGNFCRGCGYCLPCPAQINIPLSARMTLLLKRAVENDVLSEKNIHDMEQIPKCIHCNICIRRCPYNLDVPELLKANYKDFRQHVG